MEAVAHTKYLRMSPWKVRRVVGMIKGKSVQQALDTLHFTRKGAALPVYKTIQTAFANLSNQNEDERFEMSDVRIKEAYVNEGPTIKRFRPMSMGRAGQIRKRTAHVTIVVEL